MNYKQTIAIIIVYIWGMYPISAQETLTPISTDRPDMAESSEVVGKHAFQIEMGISFQKEENYSTDIQGVTTPLKLRYGVLKNVEVHLETEGLSRLRINNINSFGVGDVSLGMKAHLVDGGELSGLIPSFAVLLAVSLPNGTSGFSEQTTIPKAVLAMDWELPLQMGLGTNIAVSLPPDPNSLRTAQGFFAVSLSRSLTPLSEKFRAYIEIAGNIALAEEAENSFLLDGGFTYQPTPFFQFDCSAITSFSDIGPDYGFGFGISVKI